MTPGPQASCFIPITGNQSNRPILRLFIFLSVLLGLVATTTARAGDDIDIDSANWRSDLGRLTVRGDNAPDNSTVTIRYGEKDDNGAEIGTAEADSDGEWTFRITGLNPVPCDVTAVDDDGEDDDKEVRNAPNDCSNDGGGGGVPPVNEAPTADANGPYSENTGVAVSFSSDGSVDPDGNIASYAWTFGDGGTSNQANPSHSYQSAGNYTVTLTVTDNGTPTAATGSDSTNATITDPDQPPVNVPPTAVNDNYNTPQDTPLNVDAPGVLGNDSDGNGDAITAELRTQPGNGSVSLNANGSFNYNPDDGFSGGDSFTYRADDGQDVSNDATVTINVTSPVACTSPIQAHCQITAYTGPEVCVGCHQDQAVEMHGSVHYQQGGAFPNATNIVDQGGFAAAGERPAQAAGDLVATGINTYCGTHENSPRFTCAGCHVGNGRFPVTESEFESMDPVSQQEQLANIDCLMCHQDAYKRFPDWIERPPIDNGNGYGFTDLILLNVAEQAGNLVQANGQSVIRTGFAGIPNVDPVTGDFQFMPAGSDTLPASVPMAPMALTTLEAAQNVHLTTRQSCLNCHAGAAGADGAKRGDLSREVADNTSTTTDFHLSPQGADLTCSDCHNAGGHRLRGRGLDLRPNDVAGRFTCESCHDATPHGDFSNTQGASRDKHAQKVACQTCHIPRYGKAAVGTEVSRDWQDPHPSASACNGRGGWLPREDKGFDLIPSYTWFDGTSQVSYLGESLDNVPTVPLDASVAASFAGTFSATDDAYVIGMPNGDVTSTSLATKLYPMKEHWGKLARDDRDPDNPVLIGHSTFEFFRTGSFCRAVAVGLGLDEVNATTSSVCETGEPGTEMPEGTTSVAVHTYQTINHGVEPRGDALNCGSCHASQSGGPLQMDLGALGYGPRTLPSVVVNTDQMDLSSGDLNDICSQCHGNEDNNSDRSFNEVHNRHVSSEGKDCAACHNFSRPERNLSLSRN